MAGMRDLKLRLHYLLLAKQTEFIVVVAVEQEHKNTLLTNYLSFPNISQWMNGRTSWKQSKKAYLFQVSILRPLFSLWFPEYHHYGIGENESSQQNRSFKRWPHGCLWTLSGRLQSTFSVRLENTLTHSIFICLTSFIFFSFSLFSRYFLASVSLFLLFISSLFRHVSHSPTGWIVTVFSAYREYSSSPLCSATVPVFSILIFIINQCFTIFYICVVSVV